MNRKRMLVASMTMMLAACCVWYPAEAQTVKTPQWMTWLGNGTTSYSCTSGKCNLTGDNRFTSFTLSAGATLINIADGPLIIRATGTCTIAGKVSGSVNSGALGIGGNGDFGGGGGGGGGGTLSGMSGKTTVVVPGIPLVNGGFGGSAGGGNGATGFTVYENQYHMLLSSGSSWPGGGAAGGQGGSNGGAGGLAGTPVIFICNAIQFTGSIDVSGGNGANAPANDTGAGGGGGGGYAILAAVSYTSTSGTINVNGGVGGSCNGYTNCGSGGAGGGGFSVTMTIQ
jgi:hypothetical protein